MTALPLRTRVATSLGSLAAAASRRLGRGDGSVIGGRVILAVDPHALAPLAQSRSIAVISGTNGKTTTTRLLTEALGTRGRVVTNDRGANLPSGLVSTLAAAAPGVPAVLEVDERYVPVVAPTLRPQVLTLLNLSRDQLDRFGEVRSLSTSWRRAIGQMAGTTIVANADDPLVAWAGSAGEKVVWVGAGIGWRQDAVGCPNCSGLIAWDDGGAWSCRGCELARPKLDVWIEGDELVTIEGMRARLQLALPGRINVSNAAMAAASATSLGVSLTDAAAAMSRTREVAGRYRTVTVGQTSARLLLAKNPAGWQELFSMLAPAPCPVVVSINARIADGRDTSWLWDVPFEVLHGRAVVATGERCHDISVRLRYADVDHEVEPDPLTAIALHRPARVEVAANYTAFQAILQALKRVTA